MTKIYYVLQSSVKNLVRTEGIMSTSVLSLFVFIVTFFSFNLFLFFSHLHKQMLITLEQETDFISLQMGTTSVMAMLFFKIGALVVTILLMMLAVGNIKRSFNQILLSQQRDYEIMFLLGGSLRSLNLFNTVQVEIFGIISMLIGVLIGKEIFYASVIKTIQIGIVSEDVNSFHGNVLLTIIIMTLVLIYLFMSTFFATAKKLKGVVN